jgi:hypothetical protein
LTLQPTGSVTLPRTGAMNVRELEARTHTGCGGVREPVAAIAHHRGGPRGSGTVRSKCALGARAIVARIIGEVCRITTCRRRSSRRRADCLASPCPVRWRCTSCRHTDGRPSRRSVPTLGGRDPFDPSCTALARSSAARGRRGSAVGGRLAGGAARQLRAWGPTDGLRSSARGSRGGVACR